MICWGMRERGRPQHSKFPATELNEAGVFEFQKQRGVGLFQLFIVLGGVALGLSGCA